MQTYDAVLLVFVMETLNINILACQLFSSYLQFGLPTGEVLVDGDIRELHDNCGTNCEDGG